MYGLRQRLHPESIFVLQRIVPNRHNAPVRFQDMLKEWRGKLSQKEAAAKLDVDYPTYRKYACGKRTPCKLAQAELIRRMKEISND